MESTKSKKYNKPLIVYRIRTQKVFDITKEMVKFLIESNFVEYIYIENMKEINSEIIFGNNEKQKYFKLFDLEKEDSNLCIIIGGDGTCLWANALYKDKEKPPFLSFHGGNLGFLAIYYPEDYKKSLLNYIQLIIIHLLKERKLKFVYMKNKIMIKIKQIYIISLVIN